MLIYINVNVSLILNKSEYLLIGYVDSVNNYWNYI